MEDLWKVDTKLAKEATTYADEQGNITLSDIPAEMAKKLFDYGLVGG